LNPLNRIGKTLLVLVKSDGFIFGTLFLLGLYLSYNINFVHRKVPLPEIFSDKANYYVYLPATFIYGWDAEKFPAGIESKCQGFTFNGKTHKVTSKMTCGVALLCTPFFLLTHLIAVEFGLQPDGFSLFYQKMAILPAVFYLVLGLFFLRKFLSRYLPRGISYLTVLLIFIGTNLYYYGLDEGLMSHVYSFFLFSLFLFLLKKFADRGTASPLLFAAISIVMSLAILIRPTNVLLAFVLLFLDVTDRESLWKRILLLCKPVHLIIFAVAAFLVFLPQFMYWKYLSGSYLFYSYEGESFSNWRNPQMIKFLFSPLNGFYIYTPLALTFVAGMIVMLVKKIPNGWLTCFVFLLAVYLFSSWHMWYFGGSATCRPLVEYYAILALPFGYFLMNMRKIRNLFYRSLVVVFIMVTTWYSMTISYHPRWNTSSTWSWDDFFIYLDRSGLYHHDYDTYTYIQDFENINDYNPQQYQSSVVHSPTIAGYINKDVRVNGTFKNRLDGILKGKTKRVKASLWVNPGNKSSTKAMLVCNIHNWKSECHFNQQINFDDFVTVPNKWKEVSGTFEIPEWLDQSDNIDIFVWNFPGTPITYIDDIFLRFEKK
jgi:hypothetical protein